MKKWMLLMILTATIPNAWAETCPSVDTVKHSALTGWKAYDTEDQTPLSAKHFTQFQHEITRFVLAEWSTDKNKKGTIRCYYTDKDGSELEVYLAKSDLSLATAPTYWYSVSGSMHCAAGSDKCEFQTPSIQTAQLSGS